MDGNVSLGFISNILVIFIEINHVSPEPPRGKNNFGDSSFLSS